jgi:hypothetical protein
MVVKKTEHKKKSFLSRLKEKIVKHKKGIIVGVGVAATAGVAAYAYNKNNKIKALEKVIDKTKNQLHEKKKENSNIKRKRIEELKELYAEIRLLENFPTVQQPVTNASFTKFYEDANKRIEDLKKEAEKLYKEYEKDLKDFTNNLEKIKQLGKKKVAFGKRKNRFGEVLTDAQINNKMDTLAELSEKYMILQTKLNQTIRLYLEVMEYYKSELQNIIRIIKETDFSVEEKQKLTDNVNSQLKEINTKIKEENILQEERLKNVQEIEKKYKNEIERLNKVVETSHLHIQTLKSENDILSKDLKDTNKKLEETDRELGKKNIEVNKINSKLVEKDAEIKKINANNSLSDEEKNSKIFALEGEKRTLTAKLQNSEEEGAIIAQQLATHFEKSGKLIKEITGQNFDDTIKNLNERVKKIDEEITVIDAQMKDTNKESKEYNNILKNRIQKDEERNQFFIHDIKELTKKKADMDLLVFETNANLKKIKETKILNKFLSQIELVKNQKKTAKAGLESTIINYQRYVKSKVLAKAEAKLKDAEDAEAAAKTKAEAEAAALAVKKAADELAEAERLETERLKEIENARVAADAEAQRKREAAEAAEAKKALDNIEIKTQYITDIIKTNNIFNYSSGLRIYNNLTSYNKENEFQKVSLKGLADLLVKTIGQETAPGTEFYDNVREPPVTGPSPKIDEFRNKQLNNISYNPNDIPKYANDIYNLIDKYYKLKDSVYPVRLVINFAKRYQIVQNKNTSPATNDININIPDKNYTDSLPNKEKNATNINILNILPKELRQIKPLKKEQEAVCIPDNNYGPYYKVTYTSSPANDPNTYDVNTDIQTLFINDPKLTKEVPHIIYSAYGFSGSGKTYTLIESANKFSVLSRVVSELHTIDQSNLKQNSKNKPYVPIKLTYTMYDYYGEDFDEGCKIPIYNKDGQSSFINDRKGIDETVLPYKNGQVFQVNELNTKSVKQISDSIEDFEKLRKTNLGIQDGRTQYHIRATPNNPASSRSHLFVDIDISQGADIIGRITILDMAGSEDVNTIQNLYFKGAATDYNIDDFKNSINLVIKETSSGLNILNKEGDIKQPQQDKARAHLKEAKDGLIGIITLPTGSEENGKFIIKSSWQTLLLRLKESNGGADYDDMQKFINNYNYYNYCKLVQPLYIIKNKFIDYLEHGFSSIIINNGIGQKNGEFDSNVDIKEINKIFKDVGIGALKINNQEVNYINIRDLYEYKTKKNIDTVLEQKQNHINNIKMYIYPAINSLVKNIIKQFNENKISKNYLLLLDGYYSDIENNKEYNPDYEFQKSHDIKIFEDLKKDMYSANNLGIGSFEYPVSLMNHWNKVYLNNMHCSIRYQGNFIVRTLKQMETYIKKIQNNPKNPDNNYFPGNVLVKNPLNIGNNKEKIKFILFSNIRLDFSATNDKNQIQPHLQESNNNMIEAYINSINFTYKINPLLSDSARSNAKCTANFNFGKVKGKVSKSKKKNKAILLKHIKFLKSFASK